MLNFSNKYIENSEREKNAFKVSTLKNILLLKPQSIRLPKK